MKQWMLTLALAGTASAQTVTVDFWHSFGDAKRAGWIQARADEYNKTHPDVKIVPAYKGGYNDSLQATILAARQGKPPALVQIFEVGSQLALDSGAFQPVSGIKDVDFSDYIKPVINYYTIGGKVNSLPFNSSSPVLYFNKNLMQKAGLDPRRPPTTFGALMRDCEKIKAAGIDAKCFTAAVYGWFVEQWMSEQNALLLNNGNGRQARATESNLDSAAARNIFQFMKDVNDKGYYTYTGKLADTDGSNAIFSNQKAVFNINSTADIGNVSDAAKKAGFQLGIGVLPIPDGTKRNGVVIGGASLWVAKNISKAQAEAALDFALYMTNTKNMADWHKLTGYYPVRNSSIALLRKQGWFTQTPLQLVAFNQLLQTTPDLASAGALNGTAIQTRKIMEEGLQKVLGGQSVDAAMKDTKARVDAALREYNQNFR
ncbi:ABC transporter substrate-binding protein [Deinococcus metallilatus]|uniref:Sn-glycerol 3-phosphate transport system substrate-binding protein n=1 Tax=Deinococcus metallilatus TaxID=1211322 RepID=A0ABR6MNN9_9DEIO|nr:ABC transporter substrate-binding protein [Deinococcus metallilatus]MBB5293558.1 sn-glycerol 3-phosphate transport system substrate-binding protein [Deinococcus metallilatus]GMA15222.1 ABC transporter substrate-binding protein [Deinococcus metallilatus]